MPAVGRWRTVGVLLAAAIFVYLQVFILPDIPLPDRGGDQSIYLLNATRMYHGQVMYRDFFEFTGPGTEAVYSLLFKLWGVRAWIPEAALVLLGVAFTWLSIVISGKLVSGAAVFLPGLLFLTFPFQVNLDATHHWWSTLAVTASLALLMEARSPKRLLGAGALCGLGLWFTQITGLTGLLGLVVFLFWEWRRKRQSWRSLLRLEGFLLGGFLAAVVALNGYFAWKAGLKQFLYCTVVFGLKYYPSEPSNNWRVYGASAPSYHFWYRSPDLFVWLSIHVLLPLIYILFFVRSWREGAKHPDEPWDRLMLVNLFGLFLFLGVAGAPSYLRFCTVSLPALILLVWFAKWAGVFERIVYGLLWAAVVALCVIETAAIQTSWRATLDLPPGRQAFIYREEYEMCRWFYDRAKPSDSLFGDAYLNSVLGLPNPASIDFITPTEYTRPAQVASLVDSLEKNRVRWVVVWYLYLYGPPSPHNHLGPLRAYLASHYHVARHLAGGYQHVFERNDQPQDASQR